MSMDELQIGAGCSLAGGEPWVSSPKKELVYSGKKFKTFLIGLGHQAGVGKDTLASHLIEKLGPRPQGEWGEFFPIDIRRYAFGDELKIELFDYLQASAFVGLKHVLIDLPIATKEYSRVEKLAFINENKKALRLLLQRFGTEYRRAQNPNYWVEKSMAQVKKDNPQVAIFTDMRFENEAREMDVQINLVRPNFSNGVPSHRSEEELTSFPYPFTVVAKSKEELLEKGSFLIEELLKEKSLLPR